MSKKQFERWENGETLTRTQAMAANCYVCNGYTSEIRNDCLGSKTCPLYGWSTWGKKSRPVSLKRSLSSLKNIKQRHERHKKGEAG